MPEECQLCIDNRFCASCPAAPVKDLPEEDAIREEWLDWADWQHDERKVA